MEKQNYNSLENEAGEQKETETGEIKSFRSFLKLCWRTKTARRSIILGVIILFVGGCTCFSLCLGPGSCVAGLIYGFFFSILITISSIPVVIVGTWWGTRKIKTSPFLRLLFAIYVIVINLGFSYVLFLFVRYLG